MTAAAVTSVAEVARELDVSREYASRVYRKEAVQLLVEELQRLLSGDKRQPLISRPK